MAEDTATAPATAPTALENAPVTASEAAKSTDATTEAEATKSEAAAAPTDTEAAAEKPTEAAADAEPGKPAESADAEMKDAEPASATAEAGEDAQPDAAAAADAPATPAKSSKDKSRRKSTSTPGIKNLKKKGSMARILHLDCQPGDHYFVKTKGYTKWPAIICDDDMLPEPLIKTRPVTAKREDGSYREDFADGGKRVADRTYPVMYLETNEFAWVRNTDLHELDPKTVLDSLPSKMTKALEGAYHLAAEANSLQHYKEILHKHQEDALAEQRLREEEEKKAKAAKEAKEAEKAAKAQATPAKKSNKKKAKAADDEDVEMADADEDAPETAKRTKKRKADESAETPQRTDSVKKPKIKLTTSSTPKATNGTASTPKAKDESKTTKIKSKKSSTTTADQAETDVAAPKEPEYTPEERHQRKEKEVLFLRHKLQRGLLTKDQGPKEEEMKTMSDYIGKLEAFPDLEVSIIRSTKINKVLKAIIKLDSIPKGDEFQFKDRSQKLLNKWNQLLAVDEKPSGEGANGVNGSSAELSKKSPEPATKAKTNGVKETSEDVPEGTKDSDKKDSEDAGDKAEDKADEKAEKETVEESKEPESAAASS